MVKQRLTMATRRQTNAQPWLNGDHQWLTGIAMVVGDGRCRWCWVAMMMVMMDDGGDDVNPMWLQAPDDDDDGDDDVNPMWHQSPSPRSRKCQRRGGVPEERRFEEARLCTESRLVEPLLPWRFSTD